MKGAFIIAFIGHAALLWVALILMRFAVLLGSPGWLTSLAFILTVFALTRFIHTVWGATGKPNER